jgi:hypothetical protein
MKNPIPPWEFPERIIEDGYNSSNNSRGVSRQQQIYDITYAKLQILWL